MRRTLSFEQTPEISIPFRFFLSAPVFAMLAALLLAWVGPAGFASQWTPPVLAITHLLTLGFLSMTMAGALMQILPVVAGAIVPKANWVAKCVHLLLSFGTILLASAFMTFSPKLFGVAAICLIGGLGLLICAALLGLWRCDERSATVTSIRFSLVSLVIVIALGATLALSFIYPIHIPFRDLLDLHVAWGLLGWVAMLVFGVAFQVIPMFQVTPLYPRRFTAVFGGILFALMLMLSVAHYAFPVLSFFVAMLISGILVAAAIVTLYLLAMRRRPSADVTTLYWRCAMFSLLTAICLWIFLARSDDGRWTLIWGALFVVGFGVSVVNGMLYKIVPFLVWYHLQEQATDRTTVVPSVKQILPDTIAKRQFYLHLTALLLLVAGIYWPTFLLRIAAGSFCFSFGVLWLQLYKTVIGYSSHSKKFRHRSFAA